VHSGTVYSTCMYRQLYPLPTLCFSSAINSKMPKRRKGPVKKAPPSPPKGTAKCKNPPKVPTAAAKKAALELKDVPIPVVPAKSTTPLPDTKSPARSSQMSGAAHPVTSVVVSTARTLNDDNTQGELTMEGGGCCNGSIGLRCLHQFGQKNKRPICCDNSNPKLRNPAFLPACDVHNPDEEVHVLRRKHQS
jgi:hypothetical protein